MAKVISIEYTLKDAKTGEQLDTNVGAKPLEFISEKGQIIPGLEAKILTMSEGQKAEVIVEAKDAYGEYSDDAIQTLPVEQFAGVELSEGMTLYGSGENNETVQVLVKSFNDKDVTIDYNHPLAGKILNFNVELLNARDASEEEIQTGMVAGTNTGCGCGSNEGGGCCSDDGAKKEEGSCGCGGH